MCPGIEQWLLLDSQVVSRWRSLARTLGLDDCLQDYQAWGQGSRRRRGWRERDHLEMVLKAWKNNNPDSYNIQKLKSILLAEGLSDMWMWINIITQDSNRSHSVMSSPAASPIPPSPWSRYLYSPSCKSSISFTSESPYPGSEYSHSLSSGGSRPTSQMSYSKANSAQTARTSSLSSPSYPTTPSMLSRPDLIQLSSPRLWMRQRGEGRARQASTESASCTMSSVSDEWESLEIIEDKDNVDNCSATENTEHAGSGAFRAVTEDQSPLFHSKNATKHKSCREKYGNAKTFVRNTDKDVINRVSKMDEELLMDIKHTKVINIDQPEKCIKKVKFYDQNENFYEEQFDDIQGMIEQSVQDLNV